MITVENIKASLDANSNLSNDLKENLYELILIFHKNFKQIDLSNLNNRLQTLKIEPLNKYLTDEVATYQPLANVLSINAERLKEADAKHILMYHLLQMITAKENYSGFNYNDQFKALHIGYTELLANALVGHDVDSFIHGDEIVITNLLSCIIGDTVLREAYFQNNYMLLTQNLIDVGVTI